MALNAHARPFYGSAGSYPQKTYPQMQPMQQPLYPANYPSQQTVPAGSYPQIVYSNTESQPMQQPQVTGWTPDRETSVLIREMTVQHREANIGKREKMLAEREQYLLNLESGIHKRDQIISQREADIAAREQKVIEIQRINDARSSEHHKRLRELQASVDSELEVSRNEMNKARAEKEMHLKKAKEYYNATSIYCDEAQVWKKEIEKLKMEHQKLTTQPGGS